MSVTFAQGFRATGVTAGLKASGKPDLAVVINDGPDHAAAAVFTSNRIKAAPVLWSEEVLKTGAVKAVVLNSGGANACTGPEGFADTHRSAEHAANVLGLAPIDIAVCSTGLIGQRLPMDKIFAGIESAKQELSEDGGESAAIAIMTTDSVHKVATYEGAGFLVGGMAKGAGMLAPGLATMLVVITTDAVADAHDLDNALREATSRTFDRIDSDGCMSTNDTVLVMASGASGVRPPASELSLALEAVCADLARQLIADAEGATKDIRIDVVKAASEHDAVQVGRAVSRSNLFKCAIHGEDPNWGRILAALGTTSAEFESDAIDVAINGVWVCKNSAPSQSPENVSMKDREVVITISLNAGIDCATVWTNDLTAMYVHENSAYST